MKKWNTPEVTELNINETAHNIFGNSYDDGYIGDGHIGLLEWEKNNCGNGDGNGSTGSDTSTDFLS